MPEGTVGDQVTASSGADEEEIQLAWHREAEALARSASSPGAVVARAAPEGYDPCAVVERWRRRGDLAFLAAFAFAATLALAILSGSLPLQAQSEAAGTVRPGHWLCALALIGLRAAGLLHGRHGRSLARDDLRGLSRIWVVDELGVTVCDVARGRQRAVLHRYDAIDRAEVRGRRLSLQGRDGPIASLEPRRLSVDGSPGTPRGPCVAADLCEAIERRRAYAARHVRQG